jgi:alkanesulfonate monooxygenase SsuD/methylene tetrahydromethanopterin reductase-like flavin-dependent oxidoreductase (luciferase family)
MMGIDFPPVSERLRMMDEAVAVMRGLWNEAPCTYAGRYYRVTDGVCRPRPVQQPGPPIMLGGSGNGILRRAGEWADTIHMVPQIGAAGTTTLEELQQFTDGALPAKLARVRGAAAKAGRPAGAVRFASTIFNYSMTASPDQTQALAERMAGLFGLTPSAFRSHPIGLIGTPDEMIAELKRREQLHGLSLLAINFSTPQQIREFGERVLPHVRG